MNGKLRKAINSNAMLKGKKNRVPTEEEKI